MKSEDLLRALGEVDGKYIDEAAPGSEMKGEAADADGNVTSQPQAVRASEDADENVTPLPETEADGKAAPGDEKNVLRFRLIQFVGVAAALIVLFLSIHTVITVKPGQQNSAEPRISREREADGASGAADTLAANGASGAAESLAANGASGTAKTFAANGASGAAETGTADAAYRDAEAETAEEMAGETDAFMPDGTGAAGTYGAQQGAAAGTEVPEDAAEAAGEADAAAEGEALSKSGDAAAEKETAAESGKAGADGQSSVQEAAKADAARVPSYLPILVGISIGIFILAILLFVIVFLFRR